MRVNRSKVFFRTFLDLAFLQPLDHIPEKLAFTKSVFDPDLEFFHVYFNHPPRSQPHYTKNPTL